MNIVHHALQTLIPPNRKATSGNWISFNCPACVHCGESSPDTKKRGGLLFTSDTVLYSCFNCGFKTGYKSGDLLHAKLKKLLSWMGMPDSEISKLSLASLRQKSNVLGSNYVLSSVLVPTQLPTGARPIIDLILENNNETDLISVIEYIISRGVSIDDYQFHWSPNIAYRDRVIIPFYFQNEIVGYTARTIKDTKPKFLMSTQNGYVFNLDAQTSSRKYVIVTEGPFDAISVSGIAIMHNDPSEIQCARINSLGKDVIVVPDRDKPGSKLVAAAIKNRWSISVPPWGNDIKDVNDAVIKYGQLYVLAAILHYRETNLIRCEMYQHKLERLDD